MATVELDEDLEQACKHRDIDITDVLRVVLKLTGENDGADWHWIVRTQEGYAYIICVLRKKRFVLILVGCRKGK